MTSQKIQFRSGIEAANSIPAKEGYLLHFMYTTVVHYNEAGFATAQTVKNYAVVSDKETGNLLKLPIDSNYWEIKFLSE